MKLKSNWLSDGSNFSSIIWKNKEKLLNEMQKTITVGVITGKTPYDLSKDFARVMKVDRNRATVLLQTETARVRSMAEIESYKQMGVSKYQIIATLDDRTSDICQSMDMKVFDTKEYEVGVTAPPYHPSCRSVKAPYYEDNLITQGGRIARDPETGKQYTVGNISYSEWVEKYVKNPEQLKGYGQYARYKKVLGDKAPNSFENFVDIKYNNSKKYNSLKTLYKDTKEYNYTVDLFKNHGVPDKYIPQTLNKFIDIKLNDKLKYESIKFRKKLLLTDYANKLKEQQQLKHKYLSKQYNDELLKNPPVNKSYFKDSDKMTDNEYKDKIRKLQEGIRGKGEIIVKENKNSYEYIENYSHNSDIGVTWNRIKLMYYDTKKTRTTYSKKGYHVYPVY